MDERTSRKILQLSREQQLEEDAEEMRRLHKKQEQNKHDHDHDHDGHGLTRKTKMRNNGNDDDDDDDDSNDEGSILNLDMQDDDEYETEINRDAGYVTVHGEGLSPEEEVRSNIDFCLHLFLI